MILAPKNWESFQHYKDRAPPWIKLHKGLLDDRTFQRLPTASRALAPMLWLLASESKDGAFDGTTAELAFRLRQSEREVDAALRPLIDAGFFVVVQRDSDVLADRQQLAVPETEAEREVETDQRQTPKAPKGADGRFEEFWKAYPNKTGKDAARRAFEKRKPDAALLAQMLAAIAAQKAGPKWLKDAGQYIPNPATWLNQGRWADGAEGDGSGELTEWHETQKGVETRAAALGLPRWDQQEQWVFYKSRVVQAAKEAA